MKRISIDTYFLLTIALFGLTACGSGGGQPGKNGAGTPPKSEEFATPEYDREQIVFSLNMLSNALFNVDSSMTYLETQANEVISSTLNDQKVISKIGKWEIAWGPKIFVSNKETCGNSCAVDNLLVMFRADERNSFAENRPPKYVLATAGTNTLSEFGWFDEDFKVDVLKQWPVASGNPTSFPDLSSLPDVQESTAEDYKNAVAISIGTQTGVSELLKLTSDGMTITDWLASEFESSAETSEIAVVGHSLGGALSPTLALLLKEYQSVWNQEKSLRVTTAPTAGASPGTYGFRDHFFNFFDSNTFFGKMNSIDMVPNAWQADMMEKIPTLYHPVDFKKVKTTMTSCVIKNLIEKCVTPYLQDTYSGQLPFASLYMADKLDQNATTFKVDALTKGSNYYKSAVKGFEAGIGVCNIAKYKAVKDAYNSVARQVGCTGCALNGSARGTFGFLLEAGNQHVYTYQFHYGIMDFYNDIHRHQPWMVPEMKDGKEEYVQKHANTGAKEIGLELFFAFENYLNRSTNCQ